MEIKDLQKMKVKEAVRHCMKNPRKEWSNCVKIAEILKKHVVYIRKKRREILQEGSNEVKEQMREEPLK